MPTTVAQALAERARRWAGAVPWRAVAGAYVLCEAAFYAYYRYQLREAQWLTQPPAFAAAERRRYTWRALHALSVLSSAAAAEDAAAIGGGDAQGRAVARFRAHLSQWFADGVAPEAVGRENMVQWLAAGLFNSFPPLLSPAQRAEALECVALIERVTGHRFAPGFNPRARALRPTVDPVRALHRPLAVYACVAALEAAARALLWLQGFRRAQLGGFRYWFREGGGDSGDASPLVFMHGVGQGLLPYVHWLWTLRSRPVFLLELPHVSMRVWERVPAARETADAVAAMLGERGFARCVAVGHSFGTFGVAWLVRYRPEALRGAVLLDPVCLLLSLPTAGTAFLYRTPRSLEGWAVRLAATRELGIARVLSRSFWYWENTLWLEDLLPAPPAAPEAEGGDDERAPEALASFSPRPQHAPQPISPAEARARGLFGSADGRARSHIRVCVFMGGRDPFVPSREIDTYVRYLQQQGPLRVRVALKPELGHAHFLVSPAALAEVRALIDEADAD
jgi:pimeloyl-ACP methyl ester carboxylesterase